MKEGSGNVHMNETFILKETFLKCRDTITNFYHQVSSIIIIMYEVVES